MTIIEGATKPDLNRLESVQLLGIRIHTLSENALIDLIKQLVIHQRKAIISYTNVHAMNLAFEQPQFRRFLNRADIVFCDGHGVRLGAKLLGLDIPYRYTLPDWISLLSQMCVEHDFSIFFLGARPGVTYEASEKVMACFPTLRIVGTHHGYFDKTPGSAENEIVIEKINSAKPNIVILGFGMPLQEIWLMENWKRIDANIALTGGAVFDYISGTVKRCPRWMTDSGLEWLARLLIEPKRLWKRYLIGNPLFLFRVLRERVNGS